MFLLLLFIIIRMTSCWPLEQGDGEKKMHVCVLYLLVHLCDVGHLGRDANWDSIANNYPATDYIQN